MADKICGVDIPVEGERDILADKAIQGLPLWLSW